MQCYGFRKCEMGEIGKKITLSYKNDWMSKFPSILINTANPFVTKGTSYLLSAFFRVLDNIKQEDQTLTGKQNTPYQSGPGCIRHELALEWQNFAGEALGTHAFVESDPSETHPGEVDKGCDGGEIEEPAEDDGGTGVYSCE